jgi:1-acyl-sn-glycerol-3-phosphate acyltransferase
MLDLGLYDRVRLHPRPPLQRLIADGFLRLDYRKVDLRVEGLDRIPKTSVIYAMNHTDNFNYWPFQYTLHREFGRYTATWVKGKNYEGAVSGAFMRWTNNIPIASRGYVITRDFVNTVGRQPTKEEYRALRNAVDDMAPVVGDVPSAILEQPRDILGRPFEPSREGYHEAMDRLMQQMMARFIAKNQEALGLGLDVLVFPQGTRSRRLSRGHIGLAQVALHLGATIVPVGCSGSDEVYTSRSFLAKPGAITYRIGEPIGPERWEGIAPAEPFTPFDRTAEDTHREAFQAVVDVVMEHIDGLVDEPYQFSKDMESEGTTGVERFV